jgi:uncharacterized protein (DUF2267 family)
MSLTYTPEHQQFREPPRDFVQRIVVPAAQKPVQPEDVAAAIVKVLDKPRTHACR